MIQQVKEIHLSACLDVVRHSFSTVAQEFGLTKENCPTNGAFMHLSRLQNDFCSGHLMYAMRIHEKIAGFVQLAKKENAR